MVCTVDMVLYCSHMDMGAEGANGTDMAAIFIYIDLNDGQFSERCDVDGSFFKSDAITIIFGKA